MIAQQKAFDDDIPQWFERVSAAEVDKSRWLFVIGAGQYQETDDILYSRRSAEWFAKVAAKTLGIHPSRQEVLLDKGATSGAIKDKLKRLLSKVAKGDTIYFYYSGHGLPVPEKGNAAYMLPTDKIPDFVGEDDFYQVQQIYDRLRASPAAQVVAFMDSCFTGQTDGKSVFGGTKAATRLAPKKVALESSGKMAVLTAGNERQYSNAFPQRGHRLFSYYVMRELMANHADVGSLFTQVRAKVSLESLDLGGSNRQDPVFQGNEKPQFGEAVRQVPLLPCTSQEPRSHAPGGCRTTHFVIPAFPSSFLLSPRHSCARRNPEKSQNKHSHMACFLPFSHDPAWECIRSQNSRK